MTRTEAAQYMKKEWFAPGILIAVVTSLLSFGGQWAVKNYRLDELKGLIQQSNASTEKRFIKIDEQLDRMSADGRETIRLQERVASLERQLQDQNAQLRELDGKGQARWDNLSGRIARAGY